MTDAGFKGARVNLPRQDGRPVASGGMTLDDLKHWRLVSAHALRADANVRQKILVDKPVMLHGF